MSISTDLQLPLDYRAIVGILPHCPPFLLVDRVTVLSQQEVQAYKLLGANEPYFAGHFPGQPVMPGVLQVEALAQTAAVWLGMRGGEQGGLPYLTGIQSAKFRRPVTVGDRLDLHVCLQGSKSGFYQFTGTARVEDKITCQAVLSACVRSPEPA